MRIAALLVALVATVAQAQSVPRPAPEWRFVAANLLVARYNPLGLENQLRLGLQHRLYKHAAPAFRDNFVHLGIAPKINPAFLKLGPSIEVQPLSVLNLRVAAEWVQFFGTFANLQSFPSPLDDYSDTRVKALAEDTVDGQPNDRQSYDTDGMHLMFDALLQLKVGPIVVRDKVAAEYWAMSLRGGDTVWYDATLDTLVPGRGWVVTNDLDVLWLTDFGLIAGLRYSAVQPYYDGTDYRIGEDTATSDNGHHRLGPVVAYTFFDDGAVAFNKPTIVLVAAWYLSHRWRTGADPGVAGGQALPYLVLGFRFESDAL